MDAEQYNHLRKHYTKEFKLEVCREHIEKGVSLRELSIKHGLSSHSLIHEWLRRYKFIEDGSQCSKSLNFSVNNNFKSMDNLQNDLAEKEFEVHQLARRIAELEKQLKDAEMKAIAYSTMVDIAEKELKITIRKKFNTKP